jgi:hypothetical protein
MVRLYKTVGIVASDQNTVAHTTWLPHAFEMALLRIGMKTETVFHFEFQLPVAGGALPHLLTFHLGINEPWHEPPHKNTNSYVTVMTWASGSHEQMINKLEDSDLMFFWDEHGFTMGTGQNLSAWNTKMSHRLAEWLLLNESRFADT